jgi:signal transduction histidine kinase
MHRRLFVWFGIAIVAAAATVAVASHALTNGGSRGWNAERTRITNFVGHRFAHAWNDATERADLTRSISGDLDLDLRVEDASGRRLEDTGFPARCRWQWTAPVVQNGVSIGRVLACADRHRPGPRPGMLVLALLAACSVLWAIAGGVARRIAWPLRQLTLVTREIGEGNLSSRAGLCNWKRHDEIGELGLAINEMAERIERQLRDQRELLATVSHELRTPLTRVRLLLELAEASGADPKIAREIDGEVMEMDKLVGELLAGARVDFHALAPRLLDAGDVARRAVERSTLTDAQVVVADDAGELMADPTLLGRALVALLDNAKKYGAPPVTVRVRAQDADRGVLFEVEDRGQGFAPGDEERLMTAFTRGRDTAPDDVRGIGLGLSLVRKIAEAHGGRAFAKNVDGGGACVAIELPREPRARRPA